MVTGALEALIEDLGYEMQGWMLVFYLIPLLTIARNGLRQLTDEMDTTVMSNFVGCGQHYISIFLDHDESIGAVDWDDIVEFPVAKLAPVTSLVKHFVIDDAPREVEGAPVPL
jgi:hypothetical protein